MQQTYTQDEIDAFVKGQLSPEERSIFLQKIKEDPALLDAVAATRFQLDVSNEIIRQETLAKLRAWDAEKKTLPPPSSARTPMPSRWLWWAVAAMSAVLVVVAIFWLNEPPPPPLEGKEIVPPGGDTADISREKDKEIADRSDSSKKEYTKPPATDARRRWADAGFHRSPEQKPNIRTGAPPPPVAPASRAQRAKALFFDGQYAQVLDTLSQVKPGDPDYHSTQITLGDTYFRRRQYTQAEQAYLEVKRLGSPEYDDQVDWNLLMTYLAQHPKKQTEFKKLYDRIAADPNHPAVKDGQLYLLTQALRSW